MDNKGCFNTLPFLQVCLFNVTADPCELNNLAFKYPTVIRMLEQTLATYNSTAVPPGNKPIDTRADPKYWDYTWTNYMDFLDPKNESEIALDEEEEIEGDIVTEREIEAAMRVAHPDFFGNSIEM